MRIAAFNLENLFSRAKAMNLSTWEAGKEILDEYSKLNRLLNKATYSPADKAVIIASLKKLKLGKKDESEYVILRQNRGRLVKRPKTGPMVVVADGRSSWIGWLELKREAVNELATRMTARVVHDVAADVLGVVEAEDRIALTHFNEQLLKPLTTTYDSIMLIDGNDDRGIDVGLMTRGGYRIGTIRSHVEDPMPSGFPVFSRDCPEFLVEKGGMAPILVMVNHFKSKGHGTQAESNAKRLAQADRVRKIYNERRAQGIERIAILGDLNDVPDNAPLEPLLKQGSDLQDITQHPQFVSDGRPGTYGNGTKSLKIDYLLLSPALFQVVTGGGIFRMGVWGGTHGTLFPHYPEMTKHEHAASDHAAIWADLNL